MNNKRIFIMNLLIKAKLSEVVSEVTLQTTAI